MYRAWDGNVETCGRCSLYGWGGSVGPTTVTYDYGQVIGASSAPVVVNFASNGYHGGGAVTIALDGSTVHSQSIKRITKYTNTKHAFTITKDFTTIAITITAGTRATGPNPSMSICEIAYRS